MHCPGVVPILSVEAVAARWWRELLQQALSSWESSDRRSRSVRDLSVGDLIIRRLIAGGES